MPVPMIATRGHAYNTPRGRLWIRRLDGAKPVGALPLPYSDDPQQQQGQNQERRKKRRHDE